MAKYIIFINDDEQLMPIVFSEDEIHRDIANRIKESVVSAGFCRINSSGEYECFGESVSLGASSQDIDSYILTYKLQHESQ